MTVALVRHSRCPSRPRPPAGSMNPVPQGGNPHLPLRRLTALLPGFRAACRINPEPRGGCGFNQYRLGFVDRRPSCGRPGCGVSGGELDNRPGRVPNRDTDLGA